MYDIAEQKSKKFRHGGIVINNTNHSVGEVLGMLHSLPVLSHAVEINGDEISIAWSNRTTTREKYCDLDAVDTDDEDEAPEPIIGTMAMDWRGKIG